MAPQKEKERALTRIVNFRDQGGKKRKRGVYVTGKKQNYIYIYRGVEGAVKSKVPYDNTRKKILEGKNARRGDAKERHLWTL